MQDSSVCKLPSKFVSGLGVLLVSGLTTLVSADIIDGEDLVDPTRPFFANAGSDNNSNLDLIRTVVPASYDLTFIRAGSSAPIAVINNQQVTIGDVIGGAVVLEIDRSSVTLLINNAERRISLYGTNIKAPVRER